MKNVQIKSPEKQSYEPAFCPEDEGNTLPQNVYKL